MAGTGVGVLPTGVEVGATDGPGVAVGVELGDFLKIEISSTCMLQPEQLKITAMAVIFETQPMLLFYQYDLDKNTVSA